MTPKEAIEQIRGNDCALYCNRDNTTECKECRWGVALEALQEVECSYWIPCSERLPNEDGIYLICDCRLNEQHPWVHTAGFKVRSKSWCENHGIYYDDHYGRMSDQKKITAWRPLPEPYKEEMRNEAN